MSRSAILDAERMASDYATDLTDDFESWKQKHEAVKECWEVEDKLALFNTVVKAFVRFASRRLSKVPPVSVQPAENLVPSLLSVTASCSKVESVIRWVERDDYEVEGATEFRSIRDVVKMLLLAAGAPSNPWPVTVDRDGRLFDAGTYAPIVLPGLEPDTILRGIESSSRGETRPLNDFYPDRTQ